MSPNPRSQQNFRRALVILFSFLILYISYGVLASQIKLLRYKKSFSQVQHPQGTFLIDSLALKLEYYPATYVDDSIQFESAYLVGELRSYTGDWGAVITYYGGDTMVIPLEYDFNSQKISLEIASGLGYAFSPSVADILSNIQNHYGFWGIPSGLNRTKQSLYLVYALF